ncbi:aldehyde reductase [Stipitochalara longipes BDJ]|nr:aldehyde reductase [Stipitochalara longipes BDJ]
MIITEHKLVFGAASVSTEHGLDTPEKVLSFLDAVANLGIGVIDTSPVYGDSEELLGKANAASRFVINTKFPGGFGEDSSTKDKVIQAGKESLNKLKTNTIDIYYLHAPDPRTPLEDTLAGVNELYAAGVFKRFGLSNFTAADVENTIRISKEHNYVLPTVYQGNYSAFARHTETELFPVLRKYGVVFYAYSPSAGGFLAKTSDILRNGGTGRWDAATWYGAMYNAMYSKKSLLDGLDVWNEVAKGEGISGIEMAYRWIVHNSKLDGTLGDAVIVGANCAEQLQQTVGWVNKGSLSREAVSKIDSIWETIASDAPLDNYNSFASLQASIASN